jgi:ABC-type uncharacterized transport system auxiliary subunit
MRMNKSTRGFAMVCVAAAAIVLAACEPSPPAIAPVPESQAADVSPKAKKAATARVQPKTTASKATASKTTASTASKPSTAVGQPATTVTTAATTWRVPAPEPATSKVLAQESEAVTLTGCLEERKDHTFRLKDATGADAPKSRGWKSGFLKKGSATIDLVDSANRTKLESHVGQQISVTGMLADREMQVRSLQRVAESCD